MKKSINNNFLSLFNIISLIILVAVAVVAISLILKKSNHLDVTVKITEQNILYSSNGPRSWFAYLFHPGQAELDGFGRPTAEVKKVYYYDLSLNEKAVYLTMKIKTNQNKRSKTDYYKGKPIAVGAPIKIELEGILVEGIVVKVGSGVNDGTASKKIILEAKLFEAENFLVDSLHIADEITDADGKSKVVIKSKRVEPALIMTTDSFGNLHLRRSPLKKDVYLTLEVDSDAVNGEYYLFRDIRLVINEAIPLRFKTISLYPLVTKISVP